MSVLGPSALQGSVDAEVEQSLLRKRQRIGVVEVGQGHGSAGLAPQHFPRPIVVPDDLDTLGFGPVHHKTFVGQWFSGAGFGDHVEEFIDDSVDVLARHRADGHAIKFEIAVVGFGADRQAGSIEEIWTVGPKFVEQRRLLISGAAPVDCGEVDQDQQHPSPFDVAQELVAKPSTFGRAIDQARNIGHDHLAFASAHHAQVGHQGRERIVGNLGASSRDARDKGALTRIGETHEGHVGEEPKLDVVPNLLAHLALLGKGRHPTLVGQELGVASPTSSAFSCEPAVASVNQVGDDLATAIADHRALWHGHNQIFATSSVLLLARAVGAIGSLAKREVTKAQQRCDVTVSNQPHTAAVASVATIGATFGHMGLTTKRHTSRATVTTFDMELTLVDEIGHPTSIRVPITTQSRSAAGATLRRPCRSLSRNCRNCHGTRHRTRSVHPSNNSTLGGHEMHTSTHQRLRWLAMIAAVALLASACGGSSEDSSAAETTTIGQPTRDRSTPETTQYESGRTAEATATTTPAARAAETTTTESRTAEADAVDEVEIADDVRTRRDSTSTFALDVDTASIRLAEQAITNGWLPDPSAVRIEEFVNSFDQGYPVPDDTFAIYADGAPYELVDNNLHVLRVGVQATEVSSRRRADANITVVVDVSGSMDGAGKIELLRDSLHLLVDELSEDDRIAIVAYDNTAWIQLEPTFIDDADRIHDAIDDLRPGGSTNAEAGLRLGYEVADEMFDRGLINQVIFASDGVANVGETDPNGILRRVADDAQRGITLLAVGVGITDVNDELLERIANDGDGVYAYINDWAEAERVFGDDLLSTLVTVALDAKIQVDFDPAVVTSWRLLGFENREMSNAEFDRSSADAGEIGSGHSVTALYELQLSDRAGRRDDIGTVTLRWFEPDGEERELSGPVGFDVINDSMTDAPAELRWDVAVATAAEMFRNSPWVDHLEPGDVLNELDDITRDLRGQDRIEFADLFAEAIDLGL